MPLLTNILKKVVYDGSGVLPIVKHKGKTCALMVTSYKRSGVQVVEDAGGKPLESEAPTDTAFREFNEEMGLFVSASGMILYPSLSQISVCTRRDGVKIRKWTVVVMPCMTDRLDESLKLSYTDTGNGTKIGIIPVVIDTITNEGSKCFCEDTEGIRYRVCDRIAPLMSSTAFRLVCLDRLRILFASLEGSESPRSYNDDNTV